MLTLTRGGVFYFGDSMDPFDLLNKPLVDEDTRREMAWSLFEKMFLERKYERYDVEKLIEHSFKKTDKFITEYLEKHSR